MDLSEGTLETHFVICVIEFVSCKTITKCVKLGQIMAGRRFYVFKSE